VEQVESLVIGGGVVGLAIARELARAGREVVVLERGPRFGEATSSRNSEVIHAGIYYPAGSLKADLCVEGRARLYEYCAQRGVAHRRCGKLIVAADSQQEPELKRIEQRAVAAGVLDLRWLDGAQARTLEPALACQHALISPSTGIVDSHGLMLALLGDAQDHGAMLAVLSEAESVVPIAGGFRVRVSVQDESTELQAREVVVAAGLGAPGLVERIEGYPTTRRRRSFFAKGNYFSLVGRCPFSRLIYPIPNEAGLGVHLTLDMAGQGRFGPDVEWVDAEDYRVDPARGDRFYAEIREYWPGLPDGALQPGYAGIRPKIAGPGEAASDFVIDGPAGHGLPGLVALMGIESPGLTASLAVAARVRALLDG
jgi:L-2-hydroxyglutarate oxidase LhgO